MTAAIPTKLRTLASVTVLALLYLWVFPYHAAVNNPNENVRIYMTVAIVDDHTFAINRIEGAWGYTNDKSMRETPLSEAIRRRHVSDDVLRAAGVGDDVLARFRSGHPTPEDLQLKANLLYSSKAPGTSYMGVPVYWLMTRFTGRSTRLPVIAPPKPGAPARPPPMPIDRLKVVYALRLFGNVLPGLLFAWFWHRFLGARTRSPALREAVFFSTMAGSSLFAYSEVYASHAQNAFCFGAALMALATVRQRDGLASALSLTPRVNAGLMFLTGMFGAGCAMFEYPAGIASAAVALWIVGTAAEQRRWLLWLSGVGLGAAAVLFKRGMKPAALAAAGVGALAYALTLSGRSAMRLVMAGLGGAIPVGLTMLYHWRAFGDPLKPGYSYLENQTFREEISHGFFGATQFSWEAGTRMWLDPSFGLIPCTLMFGLFTLGLGAYLGWTPKGAVRRGALDLALLSLTGVAAVKGVLAAKAASPVLLPQEAGPWLTAFIAGSVALAMVHMPRPRIADRSMGATMALAILGMSHLMGMMNNWRGGWTVGPRYLVTLVPALGLLALAGADSLLGDDDEPDPVLYRALTLFAGASTLVAFLLTGLPSAYFPHIPTEFGAPFFEMIVPLIRDGFAPHNAGHLLHLTGNTSMVGFAFGAVCMTAMLARGDERRPVAVLAHAVGTLALTVVILAPFAMAVKPATAANARYVKSAFEPAPTAVAVPAPRPNERPEQIAARARILAERGDATAAITAWLDVMRARGAR